MSRRTREFEVPFEGGGEPQEEEELYNEEEIYDEGEEQREEEERGGEEEESNAPSGGELVRTAPPRSGFMAPHKTYRLFINLRRVFKAEDVLSFTGSQGQSIYSDVANQIRAFFPKKSEEELMKMNFFVCHAGYQGPIKNTSPHDFAISAHFRGSTPVLTHHEVHDQLYNADGSPKHDRDVESHLIALNSASFIIPGHTSSQAAPLQFFYYKKIDPASRKGIETFEPQLTVPETFWGREQPWSNNFVLVETNTVGHRKLMQLYHAKDASVPTLPQVTKIAEEEWVVITKDVKAAVDEKWNNFKGDLKLPDHFNLANKGLPIFRIHYTPVRGFRTHANEPAWKEFSETDVHGNAHAVREASQTNHIINGVLVIDVTTCC